MGATKVAKTPRTPSTKSAPIKPPSSKAKPQANGILNYFKKTADDALFVDGPIGDLSQDVDLYTADEFPEDAEETRYNEVEASNKRRRLSSSPVPDAVKRTSLGGDTGSAPAAHATASSDSTAERKVSRNPFLSDSSDDEEEEENENDAHLPPKRPSLRPTATEEGILSFSSARESSTGSSTPRLGQQDPRNIPLLREETSNAAQPVEEVPRLKHEGSTNGDFGDFADLELEDFPDDEELGGEEYRFMKYMEEQARIEAEEMGNYSSEDLADSKLEEEGMTESCPICNGSLAGLTAELATTHVNSCLDGNPTPLPALSKPVVKVEQEERLAAPELGKRFVRTAVARPGQANPIQLVGDASNGKTSGASAFTKLMSGHVEDAAWANAAAAENASRGKPFYQRTCPFYKIMPGFFICVDAFRYGAVEGCKAYFLSHFHSDHYIGLTANWSHGPIYCSKVTGSLVKSQLKTAEQYVVELEFEERVPVPGTQGVFVTMIPANHCPGSSLFLFEKSVGGRTQRILHCGDFRACPAHVNHPQLRPETIDAISGKTKQQKIDVCYLDTTYLNPRYSFPPQDDVIQTCADVCVALNNGLSINDESEWNALLRRREGGAPPGVDDVSKFFTSTKKSKGDVSTTGEEQSTEEPSEPTLGDTDESPANAFDAMRESRHRNRNRLLVICGTYSIGKERICKAIAQALGTKIFASPAKIRLCQQLGDPELSALMTSDAAAAQVHMQMLMELRADTLAEYLQAYRPHFGRIVGFRPSGWNYRPAAGAGGSSSAGGTAGSGKSVGANLPPSSVPTAHLLHGGGWRTSFGTRDLVPQRGSTRESMCFGVPYSEHSSFRELAMFVMALRIEKIVPTVNVGSEPSRRRMKGWTDRWLAERRKGGLVRVLEKENNDGGIEEEQDGKAKAKAKAKKDMALWDGKDGRGGGAYW